MRRGACPEDSIFLQRWVTAVADGQSKQRYFAALIQSDAAGCGFKNLTTAEGHVATVEELNQCFALKFRGLGELMAPGLAILNDVAGEHRVGTVAQCQSGAELSLDPVICVVAECVAADGDAGAVFEEQIAVVTGVDGVAGE